MAGRADEARGEVALTPAVLEVPMFAEETYGSADPSGEESFMLINIDESEEENP